MLNTAPEHANNQDLNSTLGNNKMYMTGSDIDDKIKIDQEEPVLTKSLQEE